MNVLIADDHASVRSVLRGIVENEGGEVVAEAANGEEAIEASGRLRPDLILLDIAMPVMNGFVAARHLHEQFPELPFIFVTQHKEKLYLDAALQCGARGFIVKSAAATELPAALKAFVSGEVYQSDLVK